MPRRTPTRDYGSSRNSSCRGAGATRRGWRPRTRSASSSGPAARSAPAFTSKAVASRAKRSRPIPSLDPGDRVTHDSFGLGTVVALDGQGENSVASVDFGSQGVKRLLLRYAPVEKL